MSDAPKKHAPRGRIKADPIQAADPSQAAPLTGGQRCTAHGKHSKKPCKNPAIMGGTVCRMHGGAAPQVMLAAEERLKAMEIPALIRLDELMHQKEFPSVAIAAVKDALDRIRGKAHESLAVAHSGTVDVVSLIRARHARHNQS